MKRLDSLPTFQRYLLAYQCVSAATYCKHNAPYAANTSIKTAYQLMYFPKYLTSDRIDLYQIFGCSQRKRARISREFLIA